MVGRCDRGGTTANAWGHVGERCDQIGFCQLTQSFKCTKSGGPHRSVMI